LSIFIASSEADGKSQMPPMVQMASDPDMNKSRQGSLPTLRLTQALGAACILSAGSLS
jgi:hypothetical protein